MFERNIFIFGENLYVWYYRSNLKTYLRIVLQKFLTSTENLLNEKLNNGSVMVVIIAFCIVCTGIIIPSAHAKVTTNILESQRNTQNFQYIIIDGKKFKIILEEVK